MVHRPYCTFMQRFGYKIQVPCTVYCTSINTLNKPVPCIYSHTAAHTFSIYIPEVHSQIRHSSTTHYRRNTVQYQVLIHIFRFCNRSLYKIFSLTAVSQHNSYTLHLLIPDIIKTVYILGTPPVHIQAATAVQLRYLFFRSAYCTVQSTIPKYYTYWIGLLRHTIVNMQYSTKSSLSLVHPSRQLLVGEAWG